MNSDVWKAFEDLGDQIERDWRSRNFAEDCFPDICTEHLRHNAALSDIDVLDLAGRLASSPVLPQQEDVDAEFGQPPVTLYRTERFYIALLYWSDSTTSIHEHQFQGAFRVVSGSSVHSKWQFTKKEEISRRLLIGCVRRISAEFLEAGEVRPILPAAQGAHALFHLERPSATVVVRSHLDIGASPQYSYFPPALAFYGLSPAPSLRRRIQLLRLLRSESEVHLHESVRRFVESDDLVTLTSLVLELSAMGLDEGFMTKIVDTLARTHGEIGEAIRESALEHKASVDLRRMRHRLKDDARFVLSLIVSGLDRCSALEVLNKKFGHDGDMRAARAIADMVRGDTVEGSQALPEIVSRLLQGQPTSDVIAHARNLYGVAVQQITALLSDSPVLARFLGLDEQHDQHD